MENRDIKMTFSQFAAILYPILGEGKKTDEFTQELFYQICDYSEDNNPLDRYSFSSFRSYFFGKNNISGIAKLINGHVDESRFYEFLHTYPSTVIYNLSDALEKALSRTVYIHRTFS